MTHPTDDELEAMAARLEASAYVRSPAHEIEAAAMLRACKGITAALEARAEKAEAERDARGRQLNTALYGDPHFGVQFIEARIESLEAERDALRAAINRAGALACQRASHAFIIDALKETDT